MSVIVEESTERVDSSSEENIVGIILHEVVAFVFQCGLDAHALHVALT